MQSFSYELLPEYPSAINKILSSLPELGMIVHGLMKHQRPRDPKVLPNTQIVIRDGVTMLQHFIRTEPGTFEEQIDALAGFLTQEFLPGAIAIQDCYSYRSEAVTQTAVRLAGYYLSNGYDGVLHFLFGYQRGEHFESVGNLDLFIGWEIGKRKIYELHFEFQDSHTVNFSDLIDACKSFRLLVASTQAS